MKWTFTSYDAANWHPLTWLSHALDFQLFGLNPAMQGRFVRRSVELKGYEGASTAWGISFEELRSALG